MNNEVAFRTNLFESKEIKPHFINDQCFGEDLANWLIGILKESEFTFSKPYQEDWGWEIEAKKNNERFFIQIGIMDESIGEENAEWLIAIEKPKSWFQFGKQNSSNFEQLCRKIDKILKNESRISEITWKE